MVPEKLTFDYDFLGGATYDYLVITKGGGGHETRKFLRISFKFRSLSSTLGKGQILLGRGGSTIDYVVITIQGVGRGYDYVVLRGWVDG